ncbi:MAG: hypothetical protein ABI806_15165 [Candidatus Solibacter sp.]
MATAAFAQTDATKRTQVSGTVSAVNADVRQITLKSDKGEDVSITTSESTLFLRIPPGETDPKKGVKTTLSTLATGDRAVVIAPASADPATLIASAVLIMSKSDVASLQQRDSDDWKKRGSTGTVASVDTTANKIMIKSGSQTYTVLPNPKTTYHRYSPDSARFADAKVSSFAQIQAGDQLRVLGNKDEYRAEINAEKIVFGSFRQLAATVTAVNAQAGEMTVKDLATKKTLTIKVDSASTMRKLPENAARMLARRYAPGTVPEQPASGAPGRGGRGGGAGNDIGQMLDNLPAMPLADLKPGDAIMVSTTQGSDAGRVTAITLLAGVEPLLTASPTATRDIMSGWNLGGNGDPGQ